MTVNHWVTGSSPVRGANSTGICLKCHADNVKNDDIDDKRISGRSSIAQLVEQMTVNHWVTGSSPVRGANPRLPANAGNYAER